MKEGSVDTTVDHISKLPVPILQKIISFLLVKNAARMGTLSKTLYSAWSSLSYLNFGDNFFYYEMKPQECEHYKFSQIVEQILTNRQKQKISIEKFWLKLPPCLCCCPYQNWIKTLVACDIKELILSIDTPGYGHYSDLPEATFAAKELNVLDLCGFKLELPCDGIKLSSLRKLKLVHASLDEHFVRALCASCSCLEDLTLDECQGLASLQIAGSNLPKLNSVWLKLCSEIKMVDIVAPNLENLHMLSSPEVLILTDCNALKSLYLSMGVTDQDLKNIYASLPNLEALYLFSCTALKKLKISSDRLECLVLEGCINLTGIELDTPSLTRFSHTPTCYDRCLPKLKLKASVLLKVDPKLEKNGRTKQKKSNDYLKIHQKRLRSPTI